MNKRGVVVDLFCGAGGASQGFKNAGFEVVGAIDIDDDACDTYEKNHGLKPWNQDITGVSFADIREHFDIGEDEVDIICGCPPCQNFSSLRDTKPWPEGEPKDELLRKFLDLVEEERPPIVVFENVPGMLSTDNGAYITYFRERIEELGYGYDLNVVNTADYGVPQGRKRAIGLCVHGASNEDIEIPEPTHAPPEEAKENGKDRWRTVADAIEGLPELERGEKDDEDEAHRSRRHHDSTMEIIRAVPKDGGSRMDLDEDLQLDCHKRLGTSEAGNVYGRMSWDEPAPTMTTRCTTPSSGRFLHPEQDRSISPREAALLMSFPEDFELPSKNDAAERVVGNAVPPKLIEILMKNFDHSDFTDEKRVTPPISQLA